jgi:hypothetical protein
MGIKLLISNGLQHLSKVAVLCGLATLATTSNGQVPGFALDNPAAQKVIAVQKLVTVDLMKQPEILGTAVSEDSDGSPALLVFVNSEAKNYGEVMRALPPALKGVNVRTHLTEPFRAYAKPSSGGGVSHTAIQTPPIQLGTSGGWSKDLANGFCCAGTLGSLVQINGIQYIMSNYHVLESDIVTGGNGLVATTGDPTIQPGLIDISCNASAAQSVGTLVLSHSLPISNVDVAIAQVTPGMVSPNGSILEIGTISKSTAAASVRQQVKKSGRTTGLTRSKISGLNATVTVSYENECAGGAAFTKTFTGQIVVANSNSSFLSSGDSGSLLVEDVNKNPRAVGLLFAGSTTSAIANPITEVLSFLGSTWGGTATMVGQ